MKKKIDKLPIPDSVYNQLLNFGIPANEINNETALTVSLYLQAMKGNVSAINELKKELADQEELKKEKIKDISKDIVKEEKRILAMLDKLTDQEKEINKEFIHNIAFLSVNLKNLSQDIAKNGYKEKYKNGVNQYGYKDRTEVKTYNAMFKNYQSAMKQLNDLILSHESHDEEDDFDRF